MIHGFCLAWNSDVVDNSGAVMILTEAEYLPLAIKAAEAAGISATRVWTISPDTQTSIWTQVKGPQLEPAKLSPEEAKMTIALRCYSSGTTGKLLVSDMHLTA